MEGKKRNQLVLTSLKKQMQPTDTGALERVRSALITFRQ